MYCCHTAVAVTASQQLLDSCWATSRSTSWPTIVQQYHLVRIQHNVANSLYNHAGDWRIMAKWRCSGWDDADTLIYPCYSSSHTAIIRPALTSSDPQHGVESTVREVTALFIGGARAPMIASCIMCKTIHIHVLLGCALCSCAWIGPGVIEMI